MSQIQFACPTGHVYWNGNCDLYLLHKASQQEMAQQQEKTPLSLRNDEVMSMKQQNPGSGSVVAKFF